MDNSNFSDKVNLVLLFFATIFGLVSCSMKLDIRAVNDPAVTDEGSESSTNQLLSKISLKTTALEMQQNETTQMILVFSDSLPKAVNIDWKLSENASEYFEVSSGTLSILKGESFIQIKIQPKKTNPVFSQMNFILSLTSSDKHLKIPTELAIKISDNRTAVNPALALNDSSATTNHALNSSVSVIVSNSGNSNKWCLSEYQTTKPSSSESPCLGGLGPSHGWVEGAPPTSFTLSPGDGLKTVYLWVATDLETIAQSLTYSQITLDTSGPLAVLSGSLTGTNNSTAINVAVLGSEVQSYQYKIGTSSSTDCTLTLGYSPDVPVSQNIISNLSTIADGPLKLCVVGKDNAGNLQLFTQATTASWVKDTLAPVAALSGVPEGPSNAILVNVRVSSVTDLTHYKYKFGSLASIDCTLASGYGSDVPANQDIVADVSSLTDGTIKLCVVGKDAAGNYQTYTDSTFATWTKDTLAPTAVLSGVPLNTNNTVNLSVAISNVGVSTYRAKVGASATADCSSALGYGTETPVSQNFTPDISAIADGNITLCVIGKDSAENTQAYSDATTATWIKNTIAPTPFASNTTVNFSSLADVTVGATIDGAIYTRANPLIGKKVTIPSGVSSWRTTSSAAIFIHAQKVQFDDNSVLSANGQATPNDNNGGRGGSGGGAPTGCGGVAGAGGSNGANGLPATGGTCMGSAGVGSGATYSVGFDNYGNGGNGGRGTNSIGGSGSNGSGGGGGATYNLWGGGGGGGGLLVIVADSITGRGFVSAEGGTGRATGPISGSASGGGGGGVIWIAAREYQGNLKASVLGGKSNAGKNLSGTNGTARIFQSFANGSLIERSFDDRWSSDGTYIASSSLNLNLPYLETLPLTASLNDAVLNNGTINGYLFTRKNPYSAKDLTVSGSLTYESGKPSSLFLRAQNLILNTATISANGTNAGSSMGGSGGNGGAGSAGCGSSGHSNVLSGGVDGFWGGGTCAGGGGNGWGEFYSVGFEYGTGGNGGNGALNSGGLGSNGAGGGGGSAVDLWSGGGGGGGLVVIVADSISGTGTIDAKGGNRSGTTSSAGGGGGGVIWVAAKSYSGGLGVNVNPGTGDSGASAGTARIFQINNDGSLTERLFSESW